MKQLLDDCRGFVVNRNRAQEFVDGFIRGLNQVAQNLAVDRECLKLPQQTFRLMHNGPIFIHELGD